MIRVVCLACDSSMVLVRKICQGGHRWIFWAKISTRSRLAAQQNHTTSKRPRERQAAMGQKTVGLLNMQNMPQVSASNNAQVYKAPAVPNCANSNVIELTSIKEPKYQIFFVSMLQIFRIFQDALDSRFHVPCFWCASIITSADFRPKWRPRCPVARRQRSPRVHFSTFVGGDVFEGRIKCKIFRRRLEELGEWFRFLHGILMIPFPTMIFELKTMIPFSRAKDKESLFYHTNTLMTSDFFLREID